MSSLSMYSKLSSTKLATTPALSGPFPLLAALSSPALDIICFIASSSGPESKCALSLPFSTNGLGSFHSSALSNFTQIRRTHQIHTESSESSQYHCSLNFPISAVSSCIGRSTTDHCHSAGSLSVPSARTPLQCDILSYMESDSPALTNSCDISLLSLISHISLVIMSGATRLESHRG